MSRQPNCLVFDPITELNWDYGIERRYLDAAGVQLIVPANRQESWAALRDADVVIVSGRLPNEVFEQMTRCVGILCYKVGKDGVDLDRAEAVGVPVTNVPDYCTEEVSDHALTLLLMAARRIPFASAAAFAGDWDVFDRPEIRAIRRLNTLTAGIVGAGRIGSRVAAKAQAFGMRTIAYDPYVAAASVPRLDLVSLDDLLSQSDAIVLCAALSSNSRHVIDDAALRRVRRSAILVNVARGELIDEAALAEALRDGRVASAALDVRSPEPPDPTTDPLSSLPGVIVTPHMAATSQQSFIDLHVKAAEGVLALLAAAGRVPAEPAARDAVI